MPESDVEKVCDVVLKILQCIHQSSLVVAELHLIAGIPVVVFPSRISHLPYDGENHNFARCSMAQYLQF